MTVFETMQEEDIKILSPLFLITDSWLQALILYKPLDSSWGLVQFLRQEPTVFPSLPLRIKATSISSKLCLRIFFFFNSASVGREGQDFGQQHVEDWSLGYNRSDNWGTIPKR